MFYTFFRWFGMIMGYPFQMLFFKRKIYFEGEKNRKWKKGSKLIISNHYSLFDYGLTCFKVFPRQLIAVTAEAPFNNMWGRIGMKFFGTIKADRQIKDMSFIEKAAETIDKGKLVQIYPEARNTPDGKMHDFKPSFVLIANMADCKILPIISDGNYGLFKRVSMIIGNEFHLSEIINSKSTILTKEEVNEANCIIYNKCLSLRQKLEDLKANKRKTNG